MFKGEFNRPPKDDHIEAKLRQYSWSNLKNGAQFVDAVLFDSLTETPLDTVVFFLVS